LAIRIDLTDDEARTLGALESLDEVPR